jgi:hypothetical protein
MDRFWGLVICSKHNPGAHPPFMLSPPWVIAIIVSLSFLGILGWRDGLGIRIASIIGVYMVAFSIVRRSVNDYWGLVYVFVMFMVSCVPMCSQTSQATGFIRNFE